MDQQKDGTTRSDGVHEKKERKRAATQSSKKQTRISVQLVGQGRHKRPEGRQRKRGKNKTTIMKRKTNVTKNKTNSNIG